MKRYLKSCFLAFSLLLLAACTKQSNTVKIVETSSISEHSLIVHVTKANFLSGLVLPPFYQTYILYNPQNEDQPDTFPADIRAADWSPDGQWIASTKSITGSSGLYLIHPDRKQDILVEASIDDRSPVFSPDGTRIAFTQYQRDPYKINIYIVDIGCAIEETEDETCVFEPIFPTEGYSPNWTSDGNSIIYSDKRREEKPGIYMIDATGTTEAVLLVEDANSPQLSPKSEKILFLSDSKNSILEEGTYTIHIDGTQLTQLTEEILYNARWSPDGEFITFVSGRDSRCIYGCNPNTEFEFNTSSLYQMTADGENLTRLTLADDEIILWYAWIPSQGFR